MRNLLLLKVSTAFHASNEDFSFQDECALKDFDLENATFTPGTCGYLCPTKSVIKFKPRFVEYKVMWPNRAAGVGIEGQLKVAGDGPLYHLSQTAAMLV